MEGFCREGHSVFSRMCACALKLVQQSIQPRCDISFVVWQCPAPFDKLSMFWPVLDLGARTPRVMWGSHWHRACLVVPKTCSSAPSAGCKSGPRDRQRSTGRLRQSCSNRCRRETVTEEGRCQTRERDRECTRSRERLRVAARVQPAFILADLTSACQAWGERPGV